MGLLSAAFKRLLHAAGLLLAVVVLNFTLIHLAPGDLADTIAGEMGGANEELMRDLRESYGLDQPVYKQLGLYLVRIVQGDLGYSYYYNSPVVDLIFSHLGPTLLLVVSSLFLAIFFGTWFGVIASQQPNGLFSHFITILSLVGYAAPVFWTGMMLLILFAANFQIFPVSGMINPAVEMGTFSRMLDVLHHLVLPVVTLSIIYLASYSRLSRASMMDVLNSDYIRTARAKGLNRFKVVYKHALRNAVLPVITIAGLQFSHLFSGAVLVESVYSWPGLGTLAFESILRRDTPTIMGILFFSAFVVILFNLLTDLSYRIIDPRIRTNDGH